MNDESTWLQRKTSAVKADAKKAILSWTTLKITIVYLIAGYFLVTYWEQVVFAWNMSGGFILDVIAIVVNFFTELTNKGLISALLVLWGLLVLFAKLIISWLLFSFKGGVARLYTIAPARAFIMWLHRENVWLQKTVKWVLGLGEKGWIWSKMKYLSLGWFHRIYLSVIAVPFLFFFLVGFIFARALRLVLANKAGEILIEKALLLVGKNIPFAHYITDPLRNVVSNVLLWVENTSNRLRGKVDQAAQEALE